MLFFCLSDGWQKSHSLPSNKVSTRMSVKCHWWIIIYNTYDIWWLLSFIHHSLNDAFIWIGPWTLPRCPLKTNWCPSWQNISLGNQTDPECLDTHPVNCSRRSCMLHFRSQHLASLDSSSLFALWSHQAQSPPPLSRDSHSTWVMKTCETQSNRCERSEVRC